MNAMGRIITIILAIFLILFLPLQYIAQTQVETIDHIVEAHTHEFTDSVRHKGSITLEDYEGYLNKINQTKELYSIEIEHAVPKTLSDLTLNIQEDTREVSNGLTIVPDINSFNEEHSIFSLSTHTHTAACYNGNLHVCNGIGCEYENSSNHEITLLSHVQTNNSWGDTIFMNYIIHSTDGGKTWRRSDDIGNTYSDQDITYAADGYYYFISENKVKRYDPITNLVNVPSGFMAFPSSRIKHEVMYRNNMFFMTEKVPGTHSPTNIYSSSDGGITFVAGTQLASQTGIENIVYGNGIYVASGYKFEPDTNLYDKLVIYTSTDGVNWVNRLSTGTGGTNLRGDVIFIGDRFICSTSAGYIYQSIDGINWSNMGHPSVSGKTCTSINNMIYGNEILLIQSSGREFFYSTDKGQSFQYILFNGNTPTDMSYFNGFFYVGMAQYVYNGSHPANSPFLKSTNLEEWIEMPPFPIPYWVNYYRESITGIAFNSVGDTGHQGSCLKEGKYYNANGKEIQPICNTVVTSIRAKYPTQTVDKGNPINTVAIATYLDGHEGEVNCSSNYNPNKGGLQTVTLTYSGKVDNAKTNGSKTATINVTVIDKKVTSIVVTPSSQTIERYENPTFIVKAYYDDGTINITTNHTMSGFNNKNIGKQVVTFRYTENNVTVTTSVEVAITNLSKVCTVCGTRYELDNNDIDNGCPNCASIITKIEAIPDLVTVNQGATLPITVYAIYKNGGKAIINNWTSNYEPLKIGYQEVTINYKGLKDYITAEVKASKKICSICGNEYNLNEDGSDPGCPICRTTIISIKAEPNPIIIDIHQPLTIMVTATFKDGHTEIVNGWTADMVPDKPGTYKVTIFYKSVTDQITIRIIDDDLTECPYCGTSFSRSKHPNGCPECSVTLIDIEASLRNGGATVIKGSKLDLEIVLIFRDTHREFTYEGYTVSNYHPDLVGEQTVIVKYKEFQQNLVVEVIDTFGKTTCPNGHVYHLNEDGSDPGCPYCIDDGEREKALVYYDMTYTTDIIEALYNKNVYRMKTGDYITIVVTKKNKSLRSQIINIFNHSKEIKTSVSCGGEVIDG